MTRLIAAKDSLLFLFDQENQSSASGDVRVAKQKVPTLREWFDNCGGWSSRHNLDELRDGIAAGLLNEQDEFGMTALHLAVSSGWLEGINELLRAGADTELRYFRTGEPPLLTAAQDLGTGNGERLNSKAMVAALIASGANPDAANHFGITPRKFAQIRGTNSFADIPEKSVELPKPRIQNAEHLAEHYHPRFKIPKREERETMDIGQAVDLYVYGPKVEGKQDTVKVRITARSGSSPNVHYTAAIETPIENTNLTPGTTMVDFGPENIASVYMARPEKKTGRTKR